MAHFFALIFSHPVYIFSLPWKTGPGGGDFGDHVA